MSFSFPSKLPSSFYFPSSNDSNGNLAHTSSNLTPLPTFNNNTIHVPPQAIVGTNYGQEYGSFHCSKYKKTKVCDTCKHMEENNFVVSNHFKQKFRIHGNLSHDTFPENKQRWFIYLLEDIPCQKQIIGSTTNPTDRWRNHKAACNNGKSKSTGMAKHFSVEGCPNDPG